jgi:hypothetical protein
MTDGNTTATQNLIYENALSSGRFQELYNDTAAVDENGNTVPVATRRKQALNCCIRTRCRTTCSARRWPIPASARSPRMCSTSVHHQGVEQQRYRSSLLAGSAAAQQTPAEFQKALYTLAGQAAAIAAGSRRIGSQDASGVGVGVAYDIGGFHADVAARRWGFASPTSSAASATRGRWAMRSSGRLPRRGVNDSVLSFAGVKDPFTGLTWVCVTSTGAKLAGTVDNGLFGAYGSLGWHCLWAITWPTTTSRNSVRGYVHALDTDCPSLTAGLNVSAMRYDKNLRGFTYGQGGYFSPQNYAELSFRCTGMAAPPARRWPGRSMPAWACSTSRKTTARISRSIRSCSRRLTMAAGGLAGLSTEYTAPVLRARARPACPTTWRPRPSGGSRRRCTWAGAWS